MNLDARAKQAARSLRSSVADAGPGLGFRTLVRRRRLAAVGGMALATVMLMGAMALASMLPVFDDERAADSSALTTTPVPTTAPIVLDENPASTTSEPVAPTTTTSLGGGTGTLAWNDPQEPATTSIPDPEPELTTTTGPATTITEPTTTTTTKPTTQPAAATFTANQASGGSGTGTGDTFWGTGVPGHLIKIWSPHYAHIQATTTVGPEGGWELTVDYGAVTPNTEFHVKADDTTTGERKYFTYTWITDAPAATFTANQTHGSCSENPPYEVLYGTGVPGTAVTLWSPYASTTVTVAADGTWQGTLTFSGAPPGTFELKAMDHTGTKIWFTFTVEGATIAFTANQAFATSSDDPPHGLYYGTGTPGTIVEIISAYGSGSVTVGTGGQWEVSVPFPTAPLAQPFEVKAKDHTGAKVVFTFERTG